MIEDRLKELSIEIPTPPNPAGSYIPVVTTGNLAFVSGQIPIEVPSGQVFRGDIKRQAEIAFEHLKNIVIDGGFALDEVVKCTIFLTDLESFDKVNQVYQKIFVGMNLPARAVVQVSGLPKEVDIEVEAIAVKKGATQDEMFRDMDFQ